MTLEILRLDGPTFDAAIPDLAVILADAVAGGASVGFVLPFTPEDAATWWQSIERDVVRGNVIVVVARLERRVVGTAQLRLAPCRTHNIAPRWPRSWCTGPHAGAGSRPR